MTWQKLLYGTVVASGLAITGTVVWLSPRPQVKAIDMIEIFQGGQERCLATQYVLSTNGTSVYTNKSYIFGAPDPSGLTWTEYVTNDVAVTRPYLTITGTNVMIITRTQEMVSADGYHMPPLDVKKIYRTTTTNRYIWGTYSNYVINGITSGIREGSAFNGTYSFASRARTSSSVIDTYYKDGNSNYRLIDYGPRGGHPVEDPDSLLASAELVGADDYTYFYAPADQCIRFAEWRSLDEDEFGIVSNATFIASTFMTNMLREAWVYTNDWQWNSISRVVERRYIDLPDDGIPESAGISCKLISACKWYADDTLAGGGGEFANFSNSIPRLAQTYDSLIPNTSGLWARLSFTNHYDYTDYSSHATNRLWLFDGQVGSRNGESIVINVPSWVVESAKLKQRYAVAQAMRWTCGSASWKSVATNEYNTYYWHTPGWSNSWESAIAGCMANTPSTVSRADAAPYVGTVGYAQPDGDGGTLYFAQAFARGSVLVVNCTTQIPHAVDFYARGETYGKGTYTNAVWNDEGYGLTENKFTRFSEIAQGSRGSITSSVVGPTNVPSSFCSAPAPGATSSRGFIILDQDAVIKWDFEYCTTALP